MKPLFRFCLGFMLMTIIGAVSSCRPESLDPEQDPDATIFKPSMLFGKDAYVEPGVDAAITEALRFGVRSIATSPSAGVPLLVVNKLSNLDANLLKDSYESGNTIAVVNPVKQEIDSYNEAHPWLNVFTSNITEGLMLFAFNQEDGYAHISYPENKEEIAPEDLPNTYYSFLSAWLTRLNEEYGKVGGFQGGDDDDEVPNLEKLAVGYKDQVTYSFSKNDYTFRQLLWSDPDKISGNGSMTVNYTVYMAHVYDGQEGAGNYYAVKVSPSIANNNMYQGRNRNKHGGSYVRYCGFICTEADFEIVLKDSQNIDYPIAFVGKPSPSTMNNSTEYEDSQSFTLQASQSVTGNIGTSKKDGGAGGVSAEIGVTEGWSWNHSEKRTVSDMEVRDLNHGSVPKWGLVFSNLPEFKYSETYGFKITDAQAFRSTASFVGSWIWYDKNGRDDTYEEPLTMRFNFEANYKLMSWISSGADLNTETFKFSGSVARTLPLINTSTAGQIELVNDLPDGLGIYDISVIDSVDGKVYKVIPTTLVNGSKMSVGYYTPLLTYVITFKARKSGSDTPVTYKYSAHDSFGVNHMETTTLYANLDFAKQ